MLQYELWPIKFQDGIKLVRDIFDHGNSSIHTCDGRLIILGMGGSGIAGRIVSSIVSKRGVARVIAVDPCDMPVDICKSDTVVAVSHSGNTWEVIEAVQCIQETKAKIVNEEKPEMNGVRSFNSVF